MKEYNRTDFYTEEDVNNHTSILPKSPKFMNLTGQVFGELKVVKHFHTIKCHTSWFCKCSCGSFTIIKTNQLNRGRERCTACAFKFISDNTKMSADHLLKEVKEKHPYYELVDSKGGGNDEYWLWYCPDCNTPFYKRPSRLREADNKICRCNKSSNFSGWTQQLREHQIKQIASDKGLHFLGWESSYVNSKSYLYVKCPIHKHYKTTVNNFTKQGSSNNCPECFKQNRGKSKRHTLEDFISRATEIHKGLYDYSEYEYIDARTGGKIFCTTCKGTFKASYDNHINKKRGCGLCKGKRAKNLYLLIIKDKGTPIGLKYGIATSTESRVKEHESATGFSFDIIKDISFDENYVCRDAETYIKRHYGNKGYLSKAIFKSGNTETVSLTKLDEILEIFCKLEEK